MADLWMDMSHRPQRRDTPVVLPGGGRAQGEGGAAKAVRGGRKGIRVWGGVGVGGYPHLQYQRPSDTLRAAREAASKVAAAVQQQQQQQNKAV